MSADTPKTEGGEIIKLDGTSEARAKKYEQYRQTKRWKMLRRAKMLYAKNQCEICGKADGRELAHLGYERLYREYLHDVLWLCSWCHADLDGRSRDSKATLD